MFFGDTGDHSDLASTRVSRFVDRLKQALNNDVKICPLDAIPDPLSLNVPRHSQV